MVEQTSFLGISLRTCWRRRLFVLGYYLLLLAFALVMLRQSAMHIFVLLPQILTFGGLLGGIKMGGPVKYYYGGNSLQSDGSNIQSLNLSGRRPFNLWTGSSPLDERETIQRDAAHFKAYRILSGTLLFVGCAYWLSADEVTAWISTRLPFLVWLGVIYAVSLPQAVLLWTEPQAPMADVIEMPAAQTS